jgi:hypothetical protein
MPSLRRIDGKTRGALLHRNGDRILFAQLSVAIKAIPGVRRYQVLQTEVEEFTVRVVAEKRVDEAVSRAFHAHFGYVPTALTVDYVESIDRDPNGKFHASICTV